MLVTGRRFKELNVETGSRDMEAPLPVETLARLPDPANSQLESDEPWLSLPILRRRRRGGW